MVEQETLENIVGLVGEDDFFKRLTEAIEKNPFDYNARLSYGQHKKNKCQAFDDQAYMEKVDPIIVDRDSKEDYNSAHTNLTKYARENLDDLLSQFEDQELLSTSLGLDKDLGKYNSIARNNDVNAMREELRSAKIGYTDSYLAGVDDEVIMRCFKVYVMTEQMKKANEFAKKDNGADEGALDREKTLEYLKTNISGLKPESQENFYTQLAYGTVAKMQAEAKKDE